MPTSRNASAIAAAPRADVERDLTSTVADLSCEHCKLALGERLTRAAGAGSVADLEVEAVIAGAWDAGYRAVRA